MSQIPYKLFELRKHSLLSQNAVAKVLEIESVDYMALENGRQLLDEESKEKLAIFYKIDKEVFDEDHILDLSLITPIEVQPEFDLNAVQEPTLFKIHDKNIKRVGFFVVVLGLFMILNLIFSKSSTPSLELSLQTKHLLAANSQGYIYFDEGRLKYKGNNANNQFNVHTIHDAVGAYVNEEVSIILLKDGSLVSVGNASDKYPVDGLRDIIEVHMADDYFLAKDLNKRLYCVGECDDTLDGLKNIEHILTYDNEYIVLDDESNIFTSDIDFVETINKLENVVQIVKDKNHSIVLYRDGYVDILYDESMDYYAAEDEQNVRKLILLENALVLYYNDGHVKVFSKDKIYDAANTWHVLAIAGAKDYMVGYTYDEILGVGNNSANKFEVETKVDPIMLDKVSNIQIEITEKQLLVHFDEVDNAEYYVLSFSGGPIIKLLTPMASFSIDQFNDASEYTLEIYAVNDSVLYLDSPVSKVTFVVDKIEVEETPLPSVEPSEIPQVTPTPTPSPSITPSIEPSETPEISESAQPSESSTPQVSASASPNTDSEVNKENTIEKN